MTQEEKAKRYDEALERAREIHFSKDEMEYIFPELKENDDEKIRKGLIENFKWFCGDYPETSKWGKDDDLLVKDIIAWLEKQDEQKPTWSEEDEEILNTIIADVSRTLRSCGIGTDEHTIRIKAIDFLKSLRPQNRWKPTELQMDVLLDEVNAWTKGCPKQKVLESLYNDLKKLMEE